MPTFNFPPLLQCPTAFKPSAAGSHLPARSEPHQEQEASKEGVMWTRWLRQSRAPPWLAGEEKANDQDANAFHPLRGVLELLQSPFTQG